MTDMINNETVADYRDNAVTYAAIDIGSNAVRLLIKQLEDDHQPRFSKVLLLRVPLLSGWVSMCSPTGEVYRSAAARTWCG